MGRAPCCEKLGLKRGPWTIEEDRLLVAYIQQNGHGNWRALPKLAGLLRCGKSCRLRWTNYLKPDIKRGNFSQEEEDNIMKLHETLGNRWSTIAAKLPGRTDNEIKNVWHTHLKKRLNPAEESKSKCKSKSKSKSRSKSKSKSKSKPKSDDPLPQPSTSDLSSEMESATTVENRECNKDDYTDSWDTLPPRTDENLWGDVMTVEDFGLMDDLSAISMDQGLQVQFPAVPSMSTDSTIIDENIEFWYDLLANAENLPEFPSF